MKALVTAVVAVMAFWGVSPAKAEESKLKEVLAEVLFVDCDRMFVQPATNRLKDQCVVFYSGSYANETSPGELDSGTMKGVIAFAGENTGIRKFYGKHAVLYIDLAKSQIISVQAPE